MNFENIKECKRRSSLTKLEIKLNKMPYGNNFDKTDFVFLKFYLTSISNLLISTFISILFLLIWGLICFSFLTSAAGNLGYTL